MKRIIIISAILLFGCKGKQENKTYYVPAEDNGWYSIDIDSMRVGDSVIVFPKEKHNDTAHFYNCYSEGGIVISIGKYNDPASLTFSKDIIIKTNQ